MCNMLQYFIRLEARDSTSTAQRWRSVSYYRSIFIIEECGISGRIVNTSLSFRKLMTQTIRLPNGKERREPPRHPPLRLRDHREITFCWWNGIPYLMTKRILQVGNVYNDNYSSLKVGDNHSETVVSHISLDCWFISWCRWETTTTPSTTMTRSWWETSTTTQRPWYGFISKIESPPYLNNLKRSFFYRHCRVVLKKKDGIVNACSRYERTDRPWWETTTIAPTTTTQKPWFVEIHKYYRIEIFFIYSQKYKFILKNENLISKMKSIPGGWLPLQLSYRGKRFFNFSGIWNSFHPWLFSRSRWETSTTATPWWLTSTQRPGGYYRQRDQVSNLE